LTILLDSHVFLWSVIDDYRLSPEAHAMIKGEELIFVSIVSLWELTIKAKLGKLVFPEDILDSIEDNGYKILPMKIEHIKEYGKLPLIHKDPFDRLIVSQAKSEDLLLITADKEILKYDIKSFRVKP